MKSKQLSIISKQLKLLNFTFFLDRQVDGDDLFRVLTDAGMKIERHRDHFKPDEDDDVWIPSVAAKGWVTISADQNIESDHLDAICDSRAQMILLTNNNSGYPQWAAAVISGITSIQSRLVTMGRPLIIRLGRTGAISRVRESSEIEARRRSIETKKVVRQKKTGMPPVG